MKDWQIVIGLEIHVQLKLNTKLFSASPYLFGAKPNTNINVVDLGYPGTMPRINKAAIGLAIKFGIAVNAQINNLLVFDRKHYFYPDIPKGYQITQFHNPIVLNGLVKICDKNIRIKEAHLEEDAGSLIHDTQDEFSHIDYNRAGCALLEIVSEADIRSISEASEYAKYIHHLVKWLDISDGNMEQGSLRMDANISVMRSYAKVYGTRCEIKNLNSFKFLEASLLYEYNRHIDILESGGTIKQETRLYNPDKNITKTMRNKENAADYRYMPEPDLPPVNITEDTIKKIKSLMPMLAHEVIPMLVSNYGLEIQDAVIYSKNKTLYDLFNMLATDSLNTKELSKLLLGHLSKLANDYNCLFRDLPIHPKTINQILNKQLSGKITSYNTKLLLEKLFNKSLDQSNIEEFISTNLEVITDDAIIDQIISKVLKSNKHLIDQYNSGNTKILNVLIGMINKASSGRININTIKEYLNTKL